MAASYGFDISGPAGTAQQAIQWLYLGYLAAVKEQNGAAMSLGRTSTFLDIYLQRDLDTGLIDESFAQELIDDFVIKLRIVRFLRTPEYDALFSGDPTWVTECLGGMGDDGRTLVTRSSFRFLQTLNNLGPAPEPNLTVMWSTRLPKGFKDFAARVSIDTSSIQYESDELMRPLTGDDTAIACCVSAMTVGKQMQFFGARVNLAKTLLYAINGGRDEKSGEQVAPASAPVTGDYLDYDDVERKLDLETDWLAKVYVDALNVIHYMHDKYAYERIEMALHDHPVRRTMAMGIAGLAVTADSLSAIRDARVKVIRDDTGLVVDYQVEGDYPAYGNNDDRADEIAVRLVERFMQKIRKHPNQGLRLRGELRAPHSRPAARRHPPNLPRLALMPTLHRLSITPVREHHGGSRAELEAELAEEGDPEIGYYHSYEITGAVNRPGVRFTLFPSGCPLRCQYCENADTWTMHNGRKVTMGRMLDEISKYAAFVTTAHGGITVSGGEPMLQIRFLEALLRRCKQDLGLHTAVDTSGFLGDRASDEFLDLVDLFLLDIKSGDPDTYRLVTSADLEPTLRFARRPPTGATGCGCVSCWSRGSPTRSRTCRRSPRSPPRSTAWSGSKCCRSTSSVPGSGPSSACPTS
jgi:hypothetical protein